MGIPERPRPSSPRAARSAVHRSLSLIRRALPALFVVFAVVCRGPDSRAADDDGGSFFGPGPLAKAHAHLDSISSCTSCHIAGSGLSPRLCLDCHDEVRDDVARRRGYHKDKGDSCQKCHPDHRGRDFAMIKLEKDAFDHSKTGFPLSGAHAGEDCASCHTDTKTWRSAPSTCVACHRDDDPHGPLAERRPVIDSCDHCHGTREWKALPLSALVFAHRAPDETDYALQGRHAKVGCTECHGEWKFAPIAHDTCTDCHDNPHRMTLPGSCESCHATPLTWAVKGFDHASTGWPLQGEHRGVSCKTCHGGHTTRRKPHDACVDCHTDPHHGEFAPRGCTDCHSVFLADFRLRGFDHAATDYPLRGKHADVSCAKCHGSPGVRRYADLPHADCDTCHTDPHEARFEPSACATCHTEAGWTVDEFDHALTAFPLQGSHAEVACETCHTDGTYRGVAFASCTDCHADDNPHGDAFEPSTCATCHTPSAWHEVTFAHGEQTSFALDGAHATASCDACHADASVFTGLDTRCESCHRAERPPGHYRGACTDCHTNDAWPGATLPAEEHARTGFALSGAHMVLECSECHQPEHPHGLAASSCVSCHEADDPHDHQLGDRCEDCHQPQSWLRTRWRHSRTSWPLRGAHRVAACSDCHAAGYTGTPTECWRCHEAEATADELAHDSGFLQTCDLCHTPYAWQLVR